MTAHACVDPHVARALKPHQREGVQFMYDCVLGRRLDEAGRPLAGCILAHSMGLGKSLAALALLYTLLKGGPRGAPTLRKAAIVCPASLCGNWRAECHKWLGAVRLDPVVLPSGKEAVDVVRDFVHCPPQRLLIASYEGFRSHAAALAAAPIGLLVCDEGHRLKSAAGNKTIDALRSHGGKRAILTGTPMQNDLDELWAMCDFACPCALPPLRTFKSIFSNPIEAGRQSRASDEDRRLADARSEQLWAMTSRFMHLCDRSVLSSHLPSRHELVIAVALSPAQSDLYVATLADARGHSRTTDAAMLGAIQRLRLVCSTDAADADADADADAPPGGGVSAEVSKISVIAALVPALVAAREKLVIACQFQRTLDLLQSTLTALGCGCLRIDGRVSAASRQQLVDRFNSAHGTELAFLLSTRAGGTGFNLVAARRLVVFDPDWNPAADEQAMRRHECVHSASRDSFF